MVHGRRAALLALVAGIALSPSLTAAEITSADEYNKKLKQYQTISPGGDTPFGEQINLYSGELSFRQADISFEGTGPLISVTRSTGTSMEDRSIEVLAFGDWDSGIPRMEALVPSISNWPGTSGCTNVVGGFSGLTMVTDDGHRRPVLRRTPEYTAKPTMTWIPPGQANPVAVVFTALTNDNWQLGCLPGGATNGYQGFVAISPEGTKYFFTHLVYAKAHTLFERENDATIRTFRKFASLYATRIEDRFGNSVTFRFNGAKPSQLDEITGSDGRRLTLAWRTDLPVISAITKHGETGGARTWHYHYAINGAMAHLTGVVLPDQSSWQYSANVGTVYRLTDAQLTATGTSCQVRSGATLHDAGPYVATVTSPSGAVGTFELAGVWHGRSYVPSACMLDGGYEGVPPMFGAFALTKRTIGGPGLAPQVWTYAYSPGQGSALRDPCAQAGACPDTAWTQVVDPDGDLTRHVYSTRFGVGEGRSLRVETYQGTATLLRTESFEYASPTQGPWPARIGISLDDITTPVAKQEQWAPMVARTITQQGVTFHRGVQAFDALARPTQVVHSNGAQHRTDAMRHEDQFGAWVLGQPHSTTNLDTASEVSRTDYDPVTALPIRSWAFGRLLQTYTWHADGTLASSSDGRDTPSFDTTIHFAHWKRGIPQTITFPIHGAISALVDDGGLIRSTRNELGAQTCYDFDAMGRLTTLAYPSEYTPAFCAVHAADALRNWNPLQREFVQVPHAEYDLPAGHWRETVRTGAGHTRRYYDALLRPVVEVTSDDNDVANTASRVVTRYDAAGNAVFRSYPVREVGSHLANIAGIRTTYDALGRPLRSEQDSELGPLATVIDYLPDFRTRTTNPRGHATTVSYLAYDEPTTEWPTAIVHPEGAFTDIVRDVFGKPRMLVRRNADYSRAVTRTYTYDAAQLLCKTIEPETGSTVNIYDGAGNITWSGSGLALPDPNGGAQCEADRGALLASGRQVERLYDQRGRPTWLKFPDGIGNQFRSYEPDGALSHIDVWNGAHQTTPAQTRYEYNQRRLMAREWSIHPGWYEWPLTYDYDANGSLASLRYPDQATTVHFTPNALGQATAVYDNAGHLYASGAQYHPNGALKQFNYGNGITRAMWQNARQLPAHVLDTNVKEMTYAYDGNGNPTQIRDLHAVPYAYSGNRDLQYDGLDRLVSAHLHWWQQDTWSYDVLDNIRAKSHNNGATTVHQTYGYDEHNRLTNIVDQASGASIVGLGYDVQGNLSNKNGGHYAFDFGNRLRKATNHEQYRYDGHGRRMLVTHPTLGSTVSVYANDGALAFGWDERTQTQTYYIRLAGSLIATREATPTGTAIRFHHTDALGSPIAVTDTAGTVIDRTLWEPFGAPIRESGYRGVGYTGHYMDGETGLTYMQQRYYDPSIGRFLSVDAVTALEKPTTNFSRYAYALNNRTSTPIQMAEMSLAIRAPARSKALRFLEQLWTMARSASYTPVGCCRMQSSQFRATNPLKMLALNVRRGVTLRLMTRLLGN